jgi:cell division protein FtsZ
MFEDFDLKGKGKSNTAASIKVIGVGGAGNNAVNRMIDDDATGIDFIAANTDKQVLYNSKAPHKLVLGEQITKGLGAGANPEIGEKAAIESEEDIKKLIKGADLVFVASGMGGGTGTGAAPVIAEIARKEGALVIGIATTPFKFEGKIRMKNATTGLMKFYNSVDSIIIVSNDRLLMELGSIPVKDSFKYSDAVLKQAVRTITDLIAMPALINLDFADVKTVMKDQGPALIGIGNAKGENKAVEAAINAINSPILEASIDGAKNAIVNITGGKDFTLDDANTVIDTIQDAANADTNIIFGVSTNDDLGDELIVSVIATGLKGTSRPKSLQAVDKEREYESSKSRLDSDIANFRNTGTFSGHGGLLAKSIEDETLNIDTSFAKFDTDTLELDGKEEESNEKNLPDFLKGL